MSGSKLDWYSNVYGYTNLSQLKLQLNVMNVLYHETHIYFLLFVLP